MGPKNLVLRPYSHFRYGGFVFSCAVVSFASGIGVGAGVGVGSIVVLGARALCGAAFGVGACFWVMRGASLCLAAALSIGS